MCHFVLVFFSPFSIAITSLGEERANLSAFRTFVRFVLVWICRFPLPLGVWEGLRFVIVALPGLFSYLFVYCLSMICSLFYKMSLVGFDLLFWLILDIFSLLFYGYRTLTFISRSSKITKQIYKEILNVQISTKAESKAGSDWWRYQQCLRMYNKTWYQSTKHKLKLAVLQTRQDKSLVNNYRITAPGLVYTICSGLSVRKLYVLRVLS